MDAAALLAAATPRLAGAGIDSARLDAELLLAHALELDRTRLYARLRDPVPAAAAQRFESLMQRRERREPVAYLTGEQEFWSLRFTVTPAVLIPRPETELLVEIPLPQGAGRGEGTERARAARASISPPHALPAGEGIAPAGATILDVGTGSGCVAIALACELPTARITATDVSPAALAVARRNALAHGVAERIDFVVSDVYDGLPSEDRFDLIVSNPPYLAPGDAASPELDFEPRGALFAGADGLAVVRRLLAGGPSQLRAGGRLLIEIGQGQADAVLSLARAAGLAPSRVIADLAGIPRVLVAERDA